MERDELLIWENRERQKYICGFEPIVAVTPWYERAFLNANDLMQLGWFWQELLKDKPVRIGKIVTESSRPSAAPEPPPRP